MIEVQLIGFTSDLRHLVVDIDGAAGSGRYLLVVDPDLFATVDDLRERRRSLELPVGDPQEFGLEPDAPPAGVERFADDPASRFARPAPRRAVDPPGAETPEPLVDPEGANYVDTLADTGDTEDTRGGDEVDQTRGNEVAEAEPVTMGKAASPNGLGPAAGPEPTLTPARIQGLLRAGRSLRSVAKAAETTVERVEPWLAPILAERRQVLAHAWTLRLERSRLGRSRDPLGAAVARNLAAKGMDPEEATWDTARRADGRWRVTVRYTHRRRSRSATWTVDPSGKRPLTAASDLARELGFTRPRRRR